MIFLVLELATDNNYLKRMTMLFCINELCQAFSKTEIEQLLLPTIIKLSEDSVPNVRFNVAKTLGQIDIEAKVMEEKVSQFNYFYGFDIFSGLIISLGSSRVRQRR